MDRTQMIRRIILVRDVEGARRPVDVGFAPTANNPSDYFSGAETAGSNPVTPIQSKQGIRDFNPCFFYSQFYCSSTISNHFVSVKVTPKHIPSLQTTFLLYRRKLLLKRHITLLALDTATRNTGYCVFENGKIIKTGVLSTKAKEPLDKMLLKIGTLLTKHQPDIVVCENTVVLRNAKVQRQLTELLGAIRFWCITNKKFYYTLNPTEWRKLVKEPGEILPKKRDELKAWSLKNVRRYTRKHINSNDESDTSHILTK